MSDVLDIENGINVFHVEFDCHRVHAFGKWHDFQIDLNPPVAFEAQQHTIIETGKNKVVFGYLTKSNALANPLNGVILEGKEAYKALARSPVDGKPEIYLPEIDHKIEAVANACCDKSEILVQRKRIWFNLLTQGKIGTKFAYPIFITESANGKHIEHCDPLAANAVYIPHEWAIMRFANVFHGNYSFDYQLLKNFVETEIREYEDWVNGYCYCPVIVLFDFQDRADIKRVWDGVIGFEKALHKLNEEIRWVVNFLS